MAHQRLHLTAVHQGDGSVAIAIAARGRPIATFTLPRPAWYSLRFALRVSSALGPERYPLTIEEIHPNARQA